MLVCRKKKLKKKLLSKQKTYRRGDEPKNVHCAVSAQCLTTYERDGNAGNPPTDLRVSKNGIIGHFTYLSVHNLIYFEVLN